MKNYPQYHTQDFLTDLFFMDWIYRDNHEAALFFKKLMDNYPHLIPYIEEARSTLQKIRIEKNVPDTATIESEWKNFNLAVSRRIRHQIKTKRILRWGAIAASIIIIFCIGIFFNQQKHTVPDYLSMLDNDSSAFFTGEIQLYLNHQDILSLSEKEKITYQNGNVIISNENKEIQKRNLDSQQKLNKLIVPYGKRMNLTLCDGSRLWVNSGTTIIYPSIFEEEKREIFINGEVYLEVAHEENRKFIVKTAKMEIAVLGTSFNISAYNDDSEYSVALVSGKVAIKNKNHKDITLLPNQRYKLTDRGNYNIESVNALDYTCWREGLMKVDSEYLNNIFKRLSRYYNVAITYDKQEDMMLKCNGKLNLDQDIHLVFNTIQTTAPVIIRGGNNRFIVKRIKKEES